MCVIITFLHVFQKFPTHVTGLPNLTIYFTRFLKIRMERTRQKGRKCTLVPSIELFKSVQGPVVSPVVIALNFYSLRESFVEARCVCTYIYTKHTG